MTKQIWFWRYHARKILITGAIVIVWVSLFMFFFRDSIFTDMSGGPQTSASYMNARTAATEAARAKLNEELQKAYKLQQEADNKKTETPTTEENVQALNKSEAGREIVSGVLTILDPWGKEMAVLQAVVLNSGLVAIPARACVGGTKAQCSSYFAPSAIHRRSVSRWDSVSCFPESAGGITV